MRRSALTCSDMAALVLLLGLAAPTTGNAQDTQAPLRPNVAVLVSVQGLGAEQLERYRPWYTSGLKRVLAEGRVEANCRFRHFLTEDAPGDASIATGVTPRVHGIVADRWLERRLDGSVAWTGAAAQPWAAAPGAPPLFYREVKLGNDLLVFAIEFQLKEWQSSRRLPMSMIPLSAAPRAGEGSVFFDSRDAAFLYALRHGQAVTGLPTAPMPGAANLRVQTLADEMVRQQQGTVVSIGGTAQGAVLLAGRTRSHFVYWFDPDAGEFTTSGAYDLSTPSGEPLRKLVAEFNERQAGRALPVRLGTSWRRLPLSQEIGPREELPAPVAGISDYQVPIIGLGFDHDLSRHPAGFSAGVGASPLVDDLVTELALAIVSRPGSRFGRGTSPDLLLLSLPGFDAVAHAYGPESEEALEVLRRLDRSLGVLLDGLEKAVGTGEVVVALTSNHGFSEIPEVKALRDKDFSGGRLVRGSRVPVDFVARLNRFVSEDLCLEPRSRPVLDAEGWGLVFSRRELTSGLPCGESRAIATAELNRAVAKALRRLFDEELTSVLFTSEADSWPHDDSLAAFARNSIAQERSPDAFLLLKPGVIVSHDPGRGSSHGGVHDSDLHVPLILWGAGITPGLADGDSTPYDLAPSLAGLLGITLPEREGHDLLAVPQQAAPLSHD
jgi:hypothetical protein